VKTRRDQAPHRADAFPNSRPNTSARQYVSAAARRWRDEKGEGVVLGVTSAHTIGGAWHTDEHRSPTSWRR
jgi:hypothetical protein